MKKILIVSTVSRQFFLFEQGNIEILKTLGYEVHGAANFDDANDRLDSVDIIRHHFDIQRSPFSYKNIKAFKQLKKIMMSDKFDVVHCHSPMGGVLARLVAKSVGISRVIYTAHGFHFYKGAPKKNWILYYPVEKFLSRFTDILITINQEDYKRALELKTKKVVYVPGIGIDTNRFSNLTIDIKNKRKEIGIQTDTLVVLSIGELIKRKNHETALKALSKIENQSFIYLICGTGELDNYLKKLTKKLGLDDKVIFLGFRNDISEICKISDIFLFPSYQEGLPVSAMEAMAAGLPIICSSVRGNIDLIDNGVGGFLHAPQDVEGFAKSIDKLLSDSEIRKTMGERNVIEVKKYNRQIVKDKMQEIYNELILH